MCLGTPYTIAEQKAVIRKMAGKDGYIRVYKRVDNFFDWGRGNVTGMCGPWNRGIKYKAGIQKAERLNESGGGWHAFRDYASAMRYECGIYIIECLARPSWVKNCGADYELKTILLTHLCFPEYPKKKVTVREFRRLVKAYEGKGKSRG